MTPRQLETLIFIDRFICRNHYAPTYAEIAQEFGVTIGTVNKILYKLEDHGYIERNARRWRGLRVVKSPIAA